MVGDSCAVVKKKKYDRITMGPIVSGRECPFSEKLLIYYKRKHKTQQKRLLR